MNKFQKKVDRGVRLVTTVLQKRASEIIDTAILEGVVGFEFFDELRYIADNYVFSRYEIKKEIMSYYKKHGTASVLEIVDSLYEKRGVKDEFYLKYRSW